VILEDKECKIFRLLASTSCPVQPFEGLDSEQDAANFVSRLTGTLNLGVIALQRHSCGTSVVAK